MDPAQFAMFLEAMTAAAAGRGGRGGQERGGLERPLIAKYVHVQTFKGNAAVWDDWSFAFKRSIRSQNLEVYKFMVECENASGFVNESADEMSQVMRDRSGELYDILCQSLGGEPMSLIKQVKDMEGIRAWQVLYKKYNPKTMARGVRRLGEVTNPPKIKDLQEIEGEISRWEQKLAVLETQFQEKLSNRLKIAVFTGMMPTVVQDYVYSIVEEGTLYETVKEKVRSSVANKVARNMGPAPMDVGGAATKPTSEEEE